MHENASFISNSWQEVAGTGNWQYFFSPDKEMNYSLIVRATDLAGNIGQASKPITISLKAGLPVANLITPLEGAMVGGTVSITGYAYDLIDFESYTLDYAPSDDPNSVTIIKSSTTPVSGENILAVWVTDSVADGEYVLRLIVKDKAGRQSEAGHVINVDNTSPGSYILNPVNGAYLPDTSLSIYGRVFNNPGGQAQISFDGGTNWEDLEVMDQYQGKAGKALYLDGSGDYVYIGSQAGLINNQWTMEAWVKPAVVHSGRRTIIGAAEYGADLSLGMEGDRFTVWTYNGGGYHCTAPDPYPMNEWSHVAGVYDGTGLKLYVNGKLAASRASVSWYMYQWVRFWVGGESCCGNYINGQIDEVRIWNVARTEADINKSIHLLLNADEPNLVLYYNFDEVQGTTIKDLSASGFNGSLQGNVYLALSGAEVGYNYGAFNYDWSTPAPGVYQIKTRAIDQAGNVEIPGDGVQVTISGSSGSKPLANISSPQDYALSRETLTGNAVEVRGIACKLSDFDNYLLEFGSGSNPAVWYEIGFEEQNQVCQNDILGIWDVSGLANDLYTLRLTEVIGPGI